MHDSTVKILLFIVVSLTIVAIILLMIIPYVKNSSEKWLQLGDYLTVFFIGIINAIWIYQMCKNKSEAYDADLADDNSNYNTFFIQQYDALVRRYQKLDEDIKFSLSQATDGTLNKVLTPADKAKYYAKWIELHNWLGSLENTSAHNISLDESYNIARNGSIELDKKIQPLVTDSLTSLPRPPTTPPTTPPPTAWMLNRDLP